MDKKESQLIDILEDDMVALYCKAKAFYKEIEHIDFNTVGVGQVKCKCIDCQMTAGKILSGLVLTAAKDFAKQEAIKEKYEAIKYFIQEEV